MPFPFHPDDKTIERRYVQIVGRIKIWPMVLPSILDLPRKREIKRKEVKGTSVTLYVKSRALQRHDDVLSITFLPSALISLLIRFTRVQV